MDVESNAVYLTAYSLTERLPTFTDRTYMEETSFDYAQDDNCQQQTYWSHLHGGDI